MNPRARWGTYRQIAGALRSRILAGLPTEGEALPSEAALGREFGVSRTTVRRALAVLESERLVKVVSGEGRVVCTSQERAGVEGSPPWSRHRRIFADLREKIIRGELAPGAALPSESALTRQYGVSRGTVRQALCGLEGIGLVVARHGKGRFVTADEQVIAAGPDQATWARPATKKVSCIHGRVVVKSRQSPDPAVQCNSRDST